MQTQPFFCLIICGLDTRRTAAWLRLFTLILKVLWTFKDEKSQKSSTIISLSPRSLRATFCDKTQKSASYFRLTSISKNEDKKRNSLAGDEGFEPPDDGVRVRSLTAWRVPNAFKHYYHIKIQRKFQAFATWILIFMIFPPFNVVCQTQIVRKI